MHEVMEASKKLINEALKGLSRGYNAEDLAVLGKAVDIVKDVKTIEAMDGEYEVEIKDGSAKMKEKMMEENIEGTEIDDNIVMMNKHFRKYCEAKKEYQKFGDEMEKAKAMRELEKFLYAMKEIMEELKTSSDFQTERDMIKGKLKEMFNLY